MSDTDIPKTEKQALQSTLLTIMNVLVTLGIETDKYRHALRALIRGNKIDAEKMIDEIEAAEDDIVLLRKALTQLSVWIEFKSE